MTFSTKPIFPTGPFIKTKALAAVGPCTTRAPTLTADLAAANIFEIAGLSTNGLRIDTARITACPDNLTAGTTALVVQFWLWDGTTAYLIQEAAVGASTPSATVVSVALPVVLNLSLPATCKLFVSTTVATTASTNALLVTLYGSEY